mmetsp:Transcript_32635/g.42151  ORF Transcript_32635/g.42151 Transcript_32635/m.42151 type:complete len:85 (+) Transcript_32635:673-927(+)
MVLAKNTLTEDPTAMKDRDGVDALLIYMKRKKKNPTKMRHRGGDTVQMPTLIPSRKINSRSDAGAGLEGSCLMKMMNCEPEDRI